MLLLRRLLQGNLSTEFCLTSVAFQINGSQNVPSKSISAKGSICYSKDVTKVSSDQFEDELNPTSRTVNHAMKTHIKKLEEYDAFRQKEIEKYEIGKRHLANMMGEDPENFTQEDIDDAIEYLFPSGLFKKDSRPKMKHPLELFPDQKSVQFGEDGRPFDSLYYTALPSFNRLLQTIALKAKKLDIEAEKLLRERKTFQKPLNLGASTWIPLIGLKNKFQEGITEDSYEFLVRSFDRFVSHPCSYLEEEFILKFRQPLDSNAEATIKIPQLMHNENGHPYMKAEGRRKTSFAYVTVTGNGSGKIEVNGDDLLYFDKICDREQVIFPLQFTNTMKSVDVSARVEGGSSTCQAGAMRYAIALALRSFVNEKTREYMRIAGLLTWNTRRHARKVYGRKGARARYTWKKR